MNIRYKLMIMLAAVSLTLILLFTVYVPWNEQTLPRERTVTMRLVPVSPSEPGDEQVRSSDDIPSAVEEVQEPQEELVTNQQPPKPQEGMTEILAEPVTGEDAETAEAVEPLPEQEPSETGTVQESRSYYGINDLTKAPEFPVRELGMRMVYPALARRQGKEGTVLLELFISAQGIVEQVDIIDDPGYGMGEAALRAFTGIHVTPASIEGSPVPVSMRYPVRFTLQ